MESAGRDGTNRPVQADSGRKAGIASLAKHGLAMIVGTNGNAIVVPRRAFEDVDASSGFSP